ncbi:hypothetical protein BGX34_006603 [Mortierella sp. NVP85]|nr:hypothetical protein BGX34_006603 [Mortierella sp. NVP85]
MTCFSTVSLEQLNLTVCGCGLLTTGYVSSEYESQLASQSLVVRLVRGKRSVELAPAEVGLNEASDVSAGDWDGG